MMSSQVIPHQIAKETDAILSCFEWFEEKGSGKNPPWVHAIRKAGISHFVELGFPTTKNEEWRFTSIAPIAALPFKPMFEPSGDRFTHQEIKRFTFDGMRCHRLVFVDGHYSPKLSAIGPGLHAVQVGSLTAALASQRFGVSKRSVERYWRQYGMTGKYLPRKVGGYRRSRLEGHDKTLGWWIEQQADLTLAELQLRCRKHLNIRIGINALWHRLERLGLSYKKNSARRRARSPRY